MHYTFSWNKVQTILTNECLAKTLITSYKQQVKFCIKTFIRKVLVVYKNSC